MRGTRQPRCGVDLQDLGIIADGAVLILDGVIREIGPSRRVENLDAARSAVEINAAGRVVMPGFVDCHTHLVFPASATSAGDEPGAVRAVHDATCQRMQKRAQAYLESMARHGTTTVEAKTGCGPDESAETKLFRVLAALKNDPIDVVPTFLFRLPASGQTRAEVEAAAEWVFRVLLPKIQRRRFAAFADVAWDADPGHERIFSRYLEVARSLGFPCKIHADQGSPHAAIDLAVRHLAASVDHLEHATSVDASLLQGCGTMATLLPYGSFCGGGRYAPARALINGGVAVALATNFNPFHTPALNMQTVVALGCMRLGMTPEEAITAATINGAHAVGLADRVGSLEPGKEADLLVLNLSDYRELVHHFGTNMVHMTMKRGRLIYKEGDVAPRPAEKVRVRLKSEDGPHLRC